MYAAWRSNSPDFSARRACSAWVWTWFTCQQYRPARRGATLPPVTNALQADLASPLPADLAQQVTNALREDIAGGDVTAALIPARQRVRGRVITREPMILCGSAWVAETYRQLDTQISLHWQLEEGARAQPKWRLCLVGSRNCQNVDGHPARPCLLSAQQCDGEAGKLERLGLAH